MQIMDMLGADDAGVEGVLDIPEKFVSVKNYRASLAHKAQDEHTEDACDDELYHRSLTIEPRTSRLSVSYPVHVGPLIGFHSHNTKNT